MGPAEFADRTDIGWKKRRFLSQTTRMALPLAERKTMGGDHLEVLNRSSVISQCGVKCLLVIQVEISISQLNTQVWNSGETGERCLGTVRIWAVCKAVRLDASIIRMSLNGKDIQGVQTNIRMKSEIKLQKKKPTVF